MSIQTLTASTLFKIFAATLLITFTISLLPIHDAAAQEDDIYELWEEITSLRAQGEYDRAIELLNRMLTEHSGDDDILKRAYNELVFTQFKKGDAEAATMTARQALERYSDLAVSTAQFPARLNETYNDLRKEMFGSLTISKPESTMVYLDDAFTGTAPFSIELLRAGEYNLRATKKGYNEYTELITIDPSGKHSLELSMERQKDTKWWLYRIGPAVLVGVLAAFALAGGSGDEAQPEPEPLPEPPAPPTN
jgi:tetratricopeptide (TPR) repeat protein